MPYKSSVQVRMVLLKKVPDARKIEQLLEPASLLFLLQQYGGQDVEIKHRLENATFPEELLLELLAQEPDADHLLTLLKENNLLKPDETPISESLPGAVPTSSGYKQPIKARKANKDKPGLLSKIIRPPTTFELIVTGFATIVISSAIPLFFGLDPIEANLILALLGGIVAGLITVPRSEPLWGRLLLGLVWSFGTLLGTKMYMNYLGSRGWIMGIEFFFPAVIGSLPALVLYYLVFFKE